MTTIDQVLAREVLDSRGNPTLEVEVHLEGETDAHHGWLVDYADLRAAFAAKLQSNPNFAGILPVGDAFQRAVDTGAVERVAQLFVAEVLRQRRD